MSWIRVRDAVPEEGRGILVAHDLQDGDPALVVTQAVRWGNKWLHPTHLWFRDDESPELDGAVRFWMYTPDAPGNPRHE
jgi:hypothetical protein